MVDSLYSAPRLSGVMRESPAYTNMGNGITDRIVLLGHIDGFSLCDPYLVLNLQDVINASGADTTSPLLRGLFEAYYSGGRDIWIVPVAPMEEYVAEVSERLVVGSGRGTTEWGESEGQLQIQTWFDKINEMRISRGVEQFTAPTESEWNNFNFYERFYQRLKLAYEVLINQDISQLISPVEALFNRTGSVDFLGQLADYCEDHLTNTGAVAMGVLGTRIDVLNNNINTIIEEITSDSRLDNSQENYKFVSVVFGEISVNITEMTNSYAAPASSAALGVLSNLPMSRSWIYQKIPVAVSPVGPDLTTDKITALSEKKINCITRTSRGKRGESFQTVIISDNTLGQLGTDFWSMGQTRILMHIIEKVRSLSRNYIGTVHYDGYKKSVESLMFDLYISNHIREYKLNIQRSTTDLNKLLVDVSFTPYTSLRQLTFVTEVGPGA